MTAARDQQMNRPTSAHRPSISSSTPNGLSRGSNPRTHSQSLSVGSINPAHRVTRRKSMSTTTANKDAVVAAVREATGNNSLESGSSSSRRNTASRASISGRSANGGGYPSFPNSLPSAEPVFGQPGFASSGQKSGSALTDGPTLASMPETEKGTGKARVRRASEGSQLRKEGKRTSSGDLRCETCGKGYKHSSCLTKHLWEHTPEWAITSKLLISKHQQVQLLEAASVLVTMNHEPSAAESDASSASPAASGSSDPNDDQRSSVDTTPPPHSDEVGIGANSGIRVESDQSKRFSSNSSAYSQSYNSVFSESASSGRPYMSHFRQYSTDGRPTTSGTSVSGSYYDDEDQADLAAAVGLLSCSYGTPNTKPVMLPPDVPPVPPLPAKFLGHHSDGLSGSTIQGQASRSYQAAVPNKDVNMDRDDGMVEDDEADRYSHRARSDDEDVGVFGKMDIA